MKLNNKGFFLAETIIVMAMVTTIMAYVYPNVTKLYETYTNKARYYDQIQDIYVLKTVYDIMLSTNNTWVRHKTNSDLGPTDDVDPLTYNPAYEGCQTISELIIIMPGENYWKNSYNIGNLEVLYLVSYTATPSVINVDFNKYLKRMRKTTNDTSAYRLIGMFNNGTKKRYASIKIDNPNPNRSCNLGG